MAEYRYEFNRRWDARVPRNDIKWYIARLHVGTADEEIEANIKERCADPAYTPALIRQSVAYALECHKRNRDLYHRVMR
jgi:hypothetical protein